ncbi:unnamed protein product [Ectocarpus sp. 4 AP-2014]
MIALITRAHFVGRVAVLAATGALSVTNTSSPKHPCAEMAGSSAPDYAAWDSIVKAHVKTSEIRGIPLNVVDYQGVRDDPNFETFVESLKNAPTSGLGKDAEYALWINTYNALAIKMVTDNPCKKSLFRTKIITSIKDIGSVVSPVWKKPAGVVGGETLALDDVENIKLRNPKDYPADPLLHACIVCASVSCPDVALTAYKPETLQADMEANMRLFLANPKKGLSLDKAKGVIKLSKIFQWFEGDFTTKIGKDSVLDALLPYMPDDVRTYVSENKGSLKVDHFEYDWGVNGPSPGAPGKGGKC